MTPPARPRADLGSGISVLADAEEVAREAAIDFARCAAAAISARGCFVVALSGGSTPRRMFKHLAARPYQGAIDWPRISFFWGDERAVPPDHADSNYRMARELLLEPLGIRAEQIHRLRGECEDRVSAARDAQLEIADCFGVPSPGEPPRFDLVHLGLGVDGHTASLFPASPALAEQERWVVSNPVASLETDRITFTPPLINRARRVVFLVAGADKAGALGAVLEGPRDCQRLPAQLIRPDTGALSWLVDRDAARELGGC